MYLNLIRDIYELIVSINFLTIFIIFFIVFVLIYHFLMMFTKDKKNIENFNKFKDPNFISLNELEYYPVINIVIPAWKEGDVFKRCLHSIENLKYPKIKVIVNAGGNEKTLSTAQSFKHNDNFIILHQKGGADRPSLGKVRAINKCLDYIDEGIIYFIDADSYINDDILLRMILPLTNYNENISFGGVRPLLSQINNDFVKYLVIDRDIDLKAKFRRYQTSSKVPGQNFCLKYEVLKNFGSFTENKKFATDRSMGNDIFNTGYKAYQVKDYRSRIYVDYSSTLKDYIRQKTIWIENFLIFSYKNKKIGLIRFIFLVFISFYMIIFLFLLFFSINLFLLGLAILLSFYMEKVRKYLVFKSIIEKKYYEKYSKSFFIKILFFIYLEAFLVLRIPFHLLFFIRRLKKKERKILDN